jgi:ketosteroid isomerase-like protein
MLHQSTGDVEIVLAGFLDAFAYLDWEAFRAYFTDDAVVFFPLIDHPLHANGREAIEWLFLSVFERARAASAGPLYLDIKPRDLLIRQIGDVTYPMAEARSLPSPVRHT